jgi:hypothetical protein
LTESDFDYDLQSPEFANYPLRNTFPLYQIHMAKLSLILRDIVATRFDPGRKAATVANLNDALQTWRQQVPAEISWTENSTNMNIFASCLCIQYNHHLILAHLESFSADAMSTIGDSPSISVRHISESAANRIATLSCSIVTRSQVLFMSHEAFQGLFLAMVVFYTQMKSSQTMLAQLGRTALNNCQLVLHGAREAWDPSPWIMKLFDNLISSLEEEVSHSEMDLLANPFGVDYHFGGKMMNLFDAAPMDPDLDMWQGQQMIGNFFGLSNEPDRFGIPELPALS